MQFIRVRGARTHNLKNVSVDLPRDRLVVITGLSGSGKSSLAFDTLYAEGQRRYVESLSAYARQFLELMEKPEVEAIDGLSPAIAIEQKAASHNPRSTVGTVTEVHDYLRLLFARAGTPHCPAHHLPLDAWPVAAMVDHVLGFAPETRVMILGPLAPVTPATEPGVVESLRGQGFIRLRVDGEVHEVDLLPKRQGEGSRAFEVVVDRLRVRPDARARLAESFETALRVGEGRALVIEQPETGGPRSHLFSSKFACPHCDFTVGELEPRLFSFNSPAGACPACDGLGVVDTFDADRIVAHPERSLAAGAIRGWDKRNPFYFQILKSLATHFDFDIETPWNDLPERVRDLLLNGSADLVAFDYPGERGKTVQRRHAFEGVLRNMERRYRESDQAAVRDELSRYRTSRPCTACQGARLQETARNVRIAGAAIHELSARPLADLTAFFADLRLPGHRATIADRIVGEIATRLRFLVDVGLDYLTLARPADTLSGGEAQRIRLASQIGSGLTGVMYVLDEPSIGLHQRDNARLLATLVRLRDLGNTVIVVEHDEEAIEAADFVIDIGPGAGVHGGAIIAAGPPATIRACPDSLTGQYLSGTRSIAVPARRAPFDPERVLAVRGARGHNLKAVDIDVPVGLLVCVTGVSGSGKSTLVNDTLLPVVANRLHGAAQSPAPHDAVTGIDHFDKVVAVDQSPIGRTPRSNPATYTGLFAPIRELFAGVPEARARGYGPGRFSFNVKGGRCETCQGDGLIKVEMHFLPDVYVTCNTCQGQRYNRETLEIRYRGLNIHEVLSMTVAEAHAFFAAVPAVQRRLQTLVDVGLGYVRLGQSATTLSGGEAQRVKLSLELSKREAGRSLYILDEPTTGLHFHDVAMLLGVLQRLREHGNTVLVIEHNLDVIKTADWVIDLGPEGGDRGGTIVACGTPEQIALHPGSHTGHYLRDVLTRARDGARG